VISSSKSESVKYKEDRQKDESPDLNLQLLMHLMPNILLLLTRIVPRNRRHAARKSRVILGGTGHFAGKLLESLALGLRDQKSGEAAEKHEQSVDLHDVVEPGGLVFGGGAAGAEGTDENLGDDGADFAGGGGDTVGGGAVAGWEAWVETLVLVHRSRWLLDVVCAYILRER
jgi:hypothetical protein